PRNMTRSPSLTRKSSARELSGARTISARSASEKRTRERMAGLSKGGNKQSRSGFYSLWQRLDIFAIPDNLESSETDSQLDRQPRASSSQPALLGLDCQTASRRVWSRLGESVRRGS